jgi:peroxiredoxin
MYPDQPQHSEEKLADISLRQFNSSLAISVACFTLGLISIALSIFVIGLFFGLIGFILAICCIHSKKLLGRPLVLWGLWLSLIGFILGLFFGYFFIVRTYLYAHRVSQQMGDKQFAKWINRPSPDFTVRTIDGNEISLSGLRGKRVILDFWATWCPPCKKEIPHFVKIRSEINPDELVIIGISSEPGEILKEFVADNAINYPVASESNLPAPYDNIRSIPTTFFIDRNGVIQKVLQGYHDLAILRENAMLPDYTEPNTLASPLSLDANMNIPAEPNFKH